MVEEAYVALLHFTYPVDPRVPALVAIHYVVHLERMSQGSVPQASTNDGQLQRRVEEDVGRPRGAGELPGAYGRADAGAAEEVCRPLKVSVVVPVYAVVGLLLHKHGYETAHGLEKPCEG